MIPLAIGVDLPFLRKDILAGREKGEGLKSVRPETCRSALGKKGCGKQEASGLVCREKKEKGMTHGLRLIKRVIRRRLQKKCGGGGGE